MNESQQQIAFVKWFRESYPGVEIWHIPSGAIMGGKTPAQKYRMIASLKQMGWTNGIPDLFIPSWGVWLEFKTEKGKVSSSQQEKLDYLNDCGYSAFVVFGLEHAKRLVSTFDTVNLRYSLGK